MVVHYVDKASIVTGNLKSVFKKKYICDILKQYTLGKIFLGMGKNVFLGVGAVPTPTSCS
jgi:hypothetical protein